MTRKLLIATPRTCLAALLALTGSIFLCTAFSQQQVKIGFISLKKVSDESLKKKAFEEEIKKLLEEKKLLRDALRKEIEDLETAKALSGPEQAKREEQKIQLKRAELVKFDSDLRREVERRQTAFEREILQDIAEAAKEAAVEKGYTWVLVDEILLYKDESADLTFQTVVKMNDKYLASRPQPEPKPPETPPGGETSSAGEPIPVSLEDALIEDVVKNGPGGRYTIKEIQPRRGSPSGSITMKSDGERLRFISQYPKDISADSPSGGGIARTPMGSKSVWRFAGKVSLSGYTFEGLDKNRPLTFILLEQTGLVHLYGKGSVSFPDGHTITIEDRQTPPTDRTPSSPL